MYRRLYDSERRLLPLQPPPLPQPRPHVDLVIPVFGAYHLFKACILTLQAHTTWPYTVHVADDCSPQSNLRDYLDELQGQVVVHKAGYRRGFPGNCNWGVSFTSAPFICLYNSDLEALPFWLTHMVHTALADPTVGVVGSRLLFPPTRQATHAGRIQHAGVAFNSEGSPYHPFRCYPANAPEVMRPLSIGAVTGACMLIRREVWDALHGLDEHYAGGQYEDIDFCLRAREAGWKIIYEPKSVLYHYEHGSGEEHVQRSSERNRLLLKEKWPNVPPDGHIFGIGV